MVTLFDCPPTMMPCTYQIQSKSPQEGANLSFFDSLFSMSSLATEFEVILQRVLWEFMALYSEHRIVVCDGLF